MLKCISSSVGVLLALSQVVASMNLSWTGNCSSAPTLTEIKYLNATSITNFTMQKLTGNDDPWYLHLALTTGPTPFIYRLLSVPDSFIKSKTANETLFCAYTIGGKKTTPKTTQGNDTCSGVVSSKCEKAFTAPGGLVSDIHCPNPPPDSCDGDALYYTTTPMYFLENACHLKSIPRMDLPKGYSTFSLLGVGYGEAEEPGSFKNYDAAVHMAIPTFLTVLPVSKGASTVESGEGRSSFVQSICAVPKKALKGSRPIDNKPNDSGGVKMVAPALGAVVMSLFSLLI